MNRRTIVIVGLACIAALSLGVALLGVVSAARLNVSSGAFAGLVSLFLIGGVLGGAAWLLGLMRAARLRQWEWFVAVLVLGPLGTLLYGLAGPQEQAAA